MEKITLTIKSDFGFAVSECVAKSGEIIITLSKIDRDEGGRYVYSATVGGGAEERPESQSLQAYIKDYISLKKAKPKTLDCYRMMYAHVRRYGDLALEEVTTEWIEGYIAHLQSSGLKANTVYLYFQKLSSVLHEAYRQGLFDDRVLQRVRRPRKDKVRKTFLTDRELSRMMSTEVAEDCRNMRDMFFFSCLSGLRFGDVSGLRREDVKNRGGHAVLEYRQQKTGSEEDLPLCREAEDLLKALPRHGRYVFVRESEQRVNKFLKRWCKAARVKKSVTFHTGRHTFCVRLLTNGVPIYTVQRLMGHSDIGTTMAYADLLDRTKSNAVKKLPSICADVRR